MKVAQTGGGGAAEVIASIHRFFIGRK